MLHIHPSELTQWLRIRGNRPIVDASRTARFWSLYSHEGAALAGAPEPLRALPQVDLLVLLTTYARPLACEAVLAQLQAALDRSPGLSSHVLVLNDKSEADYATVVREAKRRFGAQLTWLDARQRLGKPGFWKAYQVMFEAARLAQPKRALFLQDDVEFEPSLLHDLERMWAATASDPRRRVLYLFSSEEDERFGRWIWFRRRRAAPGLLLTQWFDLQAFYVDRAFFELLAYTMIPVHPNRWRRKPHCSSGVGQQLTTRLRFRANIYQTVPPFVFHGRWQSEMNASARKERPLDNRRLRRVR